MLILCPYSNKSQSAKVMDTNCRMSTVSAIVQVATIIHETSELVDKKFRRHPTVRLWRGNEVFMLDYGLTLLDYQESLENTDTVQKMMIEMRGQLARHLDLATTDAYRLEQPTFWGDERFHETNRNLMVTVWPNIYKDWLSSDDASWASNLVWPGN